MELVKIRRSKTQIMEYLIYNNDLFNPPLNLRVNVEIFASKIFSNAEQWWVFQDENPIAFMACYFNNFDKRIGFVTSISVMKDYQNKSFGTKLINSAIEYGKNKDFKKIRLEVYEKNSKAILFYRKCDFLPVKNQNGMILMNLELK